MNINTVSMIALIASLGLAQPVLAQTDQQQPAGAEQTQQNAPEQPDAAPQPPAGGTATEEQSAAPEAETDKGDMAATVDGQIVLQDNDTFLASDFVGTNVYSPQDESLGKVTDLIFAKDGTIQGVVIGVGGFLGIGQKDVAFTMDRIQMIENEDGIRLSLEATSEELADAEPFKSKQTQKVEAEAEQARQEQERRAATGAGTPNPAAPPANTQ
jgi:sporulation protein YlmC with PRC-barrel domain